MAEASVVVLKHRLAVERWDQMVEALVVVLTSEVLFVSIPTSLRQYTHMSDSTPLRVIDRVHVLSISTLSRCLDTELYPYRLCAEVKVFTTFGDTTVCIYGLLATNEIIFYFLLFM